MSIPSFNKVNDYVRYYAEQKPNNEAVVLGSRRLTYLQLADEVDKCALALIAMGVKKGDRLATLSQPNPDFLIQFLATSSIGAIWIGLNPRYKFSELDYIINDSQPCLVFACTQIEDRNYEAELIELKNKHTCIRQLITIGSNLSTNNVAIDYEGFISHASALASPVLESTYESVAPDDPALIVYTSGTTGKPKGALLPHQGLVTCARVQLGYWDVHPLRMLNFLPINHIGCVGDMSCYILVGGGTIVFMEKFHPAESMDIVQKEKVSFWGGVPSTLQMCLSLPNFDDYDLSCVQLIGWGGAAASKDLISKLIEICPRLTSSYGLTESVGSITFISPCSDIDVLTQSIGEFVPDYETRIVDSNGDSVKTGEAGEIQVRGDFIMRGYWNQPEATFEAIDQDGWLHTGDIGLRREDGNIELVGRIKEMFKSGGYNIYPREIEQVIEKHPKVSTAAVIGIDDPVYQEVGQAYVQANPGVTITQEELQQHCRQHIANYKVPKQFIIENELPLLPIGKIDKQALKRLASESNQRKPTC